MIALCSFDQPIQCLEESSDAHNCGETSVLEKNLAKGDVSFEFIRDLTGFIHL